MGCTFCATGRQGLKRDLSADEMLEQIYLVCEDASISSPRFEASAQGEPFANGLQVVLALRRLSNMGEVAVCTAGVVDGIKALGASGVSCDLSVTLHSANQEKRNRLMPGLGRYPLGSLRDSLRSFSAGQHKTVKILYGLIEGVNDSERDAEDLVAFCRDIDCLVELSAVAFDSRSAEASPASVGSFGSFVLDRGVPVLTAPSQPANPMSIKYYRKK